MKRSSPLHRKTPLKSGKRLRPVSKTNSRPVEDKQARFEWLMDHPFCELTPWFHRHAPHLIPGLYPRETATEVHHAFGSRKGRHDVPLNMVSICRPVHLWVDVKKTEGRVLCLWLKVRQGLFDPKVFKELSGMFIAGWWETHKPEMEEFVPLWRDLHAVTTWP
jgi:hypothetical protein